jgi:hypothetical protein
MSNNLNTVIALHIGEVAEPDKFHVYSDNGRWAMVNATSAISACRQARNEGLKGNLYAERV